MTLKGSQEMLFRSLVLTLLQGLVVTSICSCQEAPAKPRPTAAASPGEEDFAKRAATLRKKYEDYGFTVLIEKPFIVLGDEGEETVRQRSAHTIRWAVTKLKQDYFTKDPNHIIDVWLFKDATSYRKYLKEFFNEDPTTPFGYYSSHHRCLFMNIATGGGTLVHEIVHPYIEANFPHCPSWFNEGLASLYEQSGEEKGRIKGYTNWRLAGLQKAIRANTATDLKSVLESSTSKFYREDRGTNYAQARYLCYYLQEQGLLVSFYKEFLISHRGDPTGVRSLQKMLGEQDLDAFEKKWRAFVLTLKFNE
jgi:hypothetical protein